MEDRVSVTLPLLLELLLGVELVLLLADVLVLLLRVPGLLGVQGPNTVVPQVAMVDNARHRNNAFAGYVAPF